MIYSIHNLPEPMIEGIVEISWSRSPSDPRKVREHITLDFGKSGYTPEEAAVKVGYVIESLREQFGVKLPLIKKPKEK